MKGGSVTKNLLIVIGNGFSIDLAQQLDNKRINLSNLFENGDRVPWPADGTPGFLSKSYCPELWKLGARANMNADLAGKLIEDIITCANVSASSTRQTINSECSNVYIRAYHELVSYLKYLFIFYNNEIKDDELKRILDNEWGWGSLIKNAYENEDIESITIITYNCDIFLERILHLLNLEFQMVGFDTNSSKLRLIKPHGSISFRSKRTTVRDSFSIKYNRDSLGGGIEDLIVDEEVDFENISSINTMIPPSGESERYKLMWASTLREEVKETVNTMTEDDDVIFGGLSYVSVK